ncbi:hypothetical protein TRAPUB_5519, partial [Trametes pubescens]
MCAAREHTEGAAGDGGSLARDPEKNTAAYLQWAIEEHREAEAGADMGAGVKAAMVEDAGVGAIEKTSAG